MMERIALIPGTFDPITVGHMELVRVASGLFDRVIVCIFVKPAVRCGETPCTAIPT